MVTRTRAKALTITIANTQGTLPEAKQAVLEAVGTLMNSMLFKTQEVHDHTCSQILFNSISKYHNSPPYCIILLL